MTDNNNTNYNIIKRGNYIKLYYKSRVLTFIQSEFLKLRIEQHLYKIDNLIKDKIL